VPYLEKKCERVPELEKSCEAGRKRARKDELSEMRE